MRNWLNRALSAAAGVVVILTAATASLAAGQSGVSAPPSRLANALVIPVDLPASSSGPQDLLRNPLDEVTGTLFLTDGLSLTSGFNVDVGRVLDRYAPSADSFDGLFYSASALGSPYSALSSGGSFIGLNMGWADGLNFTFGHVSSAPGLNRYLLNSRSAFAALGGRLPYDARFTNSVLAGMTWNFAKWGGLGFSASRTAERGGVLGLSNSRVGAARTTALGVTAHVGFGGGWVTTASYSEGSTQLDLRPGALAPDASLHGESYGVALSKHGLFSKNDALGFAFARPAPNFNSGLTENSNDLQFFGRDKLFSSAAPETDIEFGYKTEFFGDAVALQANVSYQMNQGGQTGNNPVSLLSRAKIKF
jgi:hypothetical protein